MRIYITAIGKKENRYVREWCEYHFNLGIDKIIMYDNNDIDGERFEDVIGDFINSGKVILKDVRGRLKMQLTVYNQSIQEYKNECNWMAFIDVDEFITLKEKLDLKEWVKQLEGKIPNLNSIEINWMCFGDNDKLYYEDKPLIERFPNPLPYDLKCTYNFPENNHVKSILKISDNNVRFSFLQHPHTAIIDKPVRCDARGNIIKTPTPFISYNFDTAYIRHYSTKTAEEYKYKKQRGYPDQSVELSKKHLTNEWFFKRNTKTEEKLKILGYEENNAQEQKQLKQNENKVNNLRTKITDMRKIRRK